MKSIRNRLVRLCALGAASAALLLPTVANGQATTNVVMWGNNDVHQVDVPSNLPTVKQIACGWRHTYVLQDDGTVLGWGSNDYGQTTTPLNLAGVASIVCGWGHTYALKNDGDIVGWGWNSERQIDTPSDLQKVKQITCGNQHTLALQIDGTIRGWGRSDNGEIATPSGNFLQIASGAHHNYALKIDGTLQGWGLNDDGQTTTPDTLTNVAKVECGYHFTYALKYDGSVQGWGRNIEGQLQTPPGLVTTQISCYAYHSYAIQTDGSLIGWGSNSNFESITPQAAKSNPVLMVACGYGYTAAIISTVTISGVVPVSGASTGGTAVRINGNNFPSSPTVTFGGVSATDIVVLSPTVISAVTPSGTPGMAVVSVNGVSAEAFYYRPSCDGDLDNNGTIDSSDLGLMLVNYGNCYESAVAAPQEPMIFPIEAAKPVAVKK